MQAALEDLATKGLNEASDVVVTGCSGEGCICRKLVLLAYGYIILCALPYVLCVFVCVRMCICVYVCDIYCQQLFCTMT